MGKLTCCLLLIGLSVLIPGGAAFGFDRDKDPNLIGYWKLDDGSGTIAHDSSAKGHDGTLVNMVAATATLPALLPTWTDGFMGGALAFNPSTSTQGQMVNCGTSPDFDLTNRVTVAAWIYDSRPTSTADEEFVCKGDTAYSLKERGSAGDVEFFIQNAGVWNSATMTGCLTASSANTWIHLAGTYDGTTVKLYRNGVQGATFAYAGSAALNTMPVSIGAEWQTATTGRRWLRGRIDEARIYSRALTDVEVASLLVNPQASKGVPASMATDLNRDGQTLSWTPGDGAVKHNVYLGTDPNAMPLVSAGQDLNTFSLGRLDLGATYFWRVDEVKADGTITKGYVWQFTVEPAAYAIATASITATASASDVAAGALPVNTVNGSGLTGDLHGTDPKTMWATGATTQPVWIQYNFNRVYDLTQMLVWNYNAEFEFALGFGLMNVTVQYSSDGVTFTNLGDFVFNQADSAAGYKYNTTVNFGGIPVKAVKILANSNYGGAQYGLSEVRFLYVRTQATAPQPANAATGVAPNVTLTWRAGRDVASHNVYLGTDPNVLSLVGSTNSTSFAPVGLIVATTYYWRVDEVNAANATSTWSSDVWSFTTAPYSVVDDMESYNDSSNQIFNAWVDGFGTTTNGAVVGLAVAAGGTFGSTTIRHGGSQSMPLAYNNSGSVTNSEATRTFSSVQDWTLYNVNVLTLYFYGQAANSTAVPLWVKLTDQSGKTAKVTFGAGAGEDPIVLADPAWTTWSIPLSSFSGISLSKIKSMTIGLGNGAGTGTLYIDDIRLVPATTTTVVTPTLVGWWRLDNDVKDSSGNNNNGTIAGTPTYVATGKIGASLRLNGTTDYVDCGTGATLNILDQITVAAWIKPTDITAYRDIVGKGDHAYAIRAYTSQIQFYFYYAAGWHQYNSPTQTSLFNGVWHHVAASYDGVQVRIYIDGLLVTSGLYTGGVATATQSVSIGRNTEATGRFFYGELDDVRIYRGALPTSEIKKLANP